jgi:hypothetical protein
MAPTLLRMTEVYAHGQRPFRIGMYLPSTPYAVRALMIFSTSFGLCLLERRRETP